MSNFVFKARALHWLSKLNLEQLKLVKQLSIAEISRKNIIYLKLADKYKDNPKEFKRLCHKKNL